MELYWANVFQKMLFHVVLDKFWAKVGGLQQSKVFIAAFCWEGLLGPSHTIVGPTFYGGYYNLMTQNGKLQTGDIGQGLFM